MKDSSQVAVPLSAITIMTLLLVLFPPSSNAVITCGTVIQNVAPCVSYLRGGSGMPSAACCSGAKALAAAATTTSDRQAACKCLKSASQTLNPNPGLAKSLPGKCGISLGFTISANVDCTKIT